MEEHRSTIEVSSKDQRSDSLPWIWAAYEHDIARLLLLDEMGKEDVTSGQVTQEQPESVERFFTWQASRHAPVGDGRGIISAKPDFHNQQFREA